MADDFDFGFSAVSTEEFTKAQKTDPLTQRMEQLRAVRDSDVPQGVSRI